MHSIPKTHKRLIRQTRQKLQEQFGQVLQVTPLPLRTSRRCSDSINEAPSESIPFFAVGDFAGGNALSLEAITLT